MAKHRKNPDRPDPTYDVGYQKPPDEHKFKPGHRGFGPRRKKRIDLHEIIGKALLRNITLPGEGGPRTMQVVEAIVERLIVQVTNNPAKYLKPNLGLIQGAVVAQDKAAGFDENGVDVAAAFRAKIEQLAERHRMHQALDAGKTNDESLSEPDESKT